MGTSQLQTKRKGVGGKGVIILTLGGCVISAALGLDTCIMSRNRVEIVIEPQ